MTAFVNSAENRDVHSDEQSRRFGNFLKDLRDEAGLSVHDIASTLNIDSERVLEWEKGVVVPPRNALHHLGRLFSISLNELDEVFDHHLRNLAETKSISPTVPASSKQE